MSNLEKINALMLCDIIKHFDIASSVKPDVVEYAITSGNMWMLDAEYSILGQDEPTKEVRDFVVAVLYMYRGLSAALRKLSPEDQSNLREKISFNLNEKDIQIPGFDGNNESEYVSVIDAFHAMNRFGEQVAPIDNTHEPTISTYEVMLKKYRALDPLRRSHKLTFDEIYSVLSEAPRTF